MEMGHSLCQSHKIGLPSFRPLCHIVNLLGSKGDISGEAVNLALKDYYEKHPMEGLACRVEDLYQQELRTSVQAIAYWIRSVNPNAIKVAALCLDERVSGSETDTLEAALNVARNVLTLYEDSRSLLAQKADTVRSKIALEKADEIYKLVKTSFKANRSYLERVLTNNDYNIYTIDETLRRIEKD